MKKILLLPPLFISLFIAAQNVGIGTTTPQATLEVIRGTSPNGTAMFRGTTHTSFLTTEFLKILISGPERITATLFLII